MKVDRVSGIHIVVLLGIVALAIVIAFPRVQSILTKNAAENDGIRLTQRMGITLPDNYMAYAYHKSNQSESAIKIFPNNPRNTYSILVEHFKKGRFIHSDQSDGNNQKLLSHTCLGKKCPGLLLKSYQMPLRLSGYRITVYKDEYEEFFNDGNNQRSLQRILQAVSAFNHHGEAFLVMAEGPMKFFDDKTLKDIIMQINTR